MFTAELDGPVADSPDAFFVVLLVCRANGLVGLSVGNGGRGWVFVLVDC